MLGPGAGWLRSEHDLARGHAEALVHARERPAGSACGPFRSRCGVCVSRRR
ncbi:DUF4287 domain-containing protein [Streptomyces sp. NPDC018000]|uniref:DUF4287 domain-containing protein n=1 Tax=Streptomyces sp. NPDC018000 TaxID=3365028 RepID=UPI0037B9BCA5